MEDKIKRIGRISGDANYIDKRLKGASISNNDALKELNNLEHELNSIRYNKEEENIMKFIKYAKSEIMSIKNRIQYCQE